MPGFLSPGRPKTKSAPTGGSGHTQWASVGPFFDARAQRCDSATKRHTTTIAASTANKIFTQL